MQADGIIFRLQTRTKGKSGDCRCCATEYAPNYLHGALRLRVGDLDNNGGLDLLLVSSTPVPTESKCPPQCIAGALVWLSDEKGSFRLLEKALPGARLR